MRTRKRATASSSLWTTIAQVAKPFVVESKRESLLGVLVNDLKDEDSVVIIFLPQGGPSLDRLYRI
jgi:hypothetical protein